jgi:hypothetical protein
MKQNIELEIRVHIMGTAQRCNLLSNSSTNKVMPGNCLKSQINRKKVLKISMKTSLINKQKFHPKENPKDIKEPPKFGHY